MKKLLLLFVTLLASLSAWAGDVTVNIVGSGTVDVTYDGSTTEQNISSGWNMSLSGSLTLTMTPAQGYTLQELQVVNNIGTSYGSTTENNGVYTYTIPNVGFYTITYTVVFSQTGSTTYTLSGSQGMIFTVEGDTVTEAEAGQRVDITLPAPGNHSYWVVSSSGIAIQRDDANHFHFTMPAKSVTVAAQLISLVAYSINDQSTNGHVNVNGGSPNGQSYYPGDIITLAPVPNVNYEYEPGTLVASRDMDNQRIDLNDNGDGTWSFTMPEDQVTVWATFRQVQGVYVNENNFPDENFRDWLLEKDYDENGVLTEDVIEGITEINVSNNNVFDLTGIEHFTALTKLYCNENHLTSLDVSHNTALTYLECIENQINGVNMEALVASLPTVDIDNNGGRHGEFRVIDLDSETEQNVITTSQVTTARDKNWTVYVLTNNDWVEYFDIIEISYIDENRETKSHEAIVLTRNETWLGEDEQESWYVAKDTLNYTQTLNIAGDVHLILADGAVMNIGTEASPVSGYGINGNEHEETTLTIYGQTLDDDTAGHLNINTDEECIYIDGDYAQHSGNVTANSSDASGVVPWYNFTFTGGTLYVTAQGNAIYPDGNVDILGGKLSAIGGYKGIYSYIGIITLGWKNADDEFTISSFSHASDKSDIKIVDGQAFTDGENIYDSTTPPEVLWALTNVTLRPVVKLEGVQFADNHYATWYGDQNLTVPEGLEAYVVSAVEDDKAVVEPISYIPAGVGVLLYSETSCENIYTGKYHGTTETVTSLLTGSLESQTVNDGYLLYNDSFVRAESGTTIAPHRCYLPVENPSSAPSLLRIVNPNVTTGIEDLTVPASGNGQRYNLMGQPVGPDYRGIVIQNGKKILVK